MIVEAIADLSDRTGCSRIAIERWIMASYPKLNYKRFVLVRAFKSAEARGVIVRHHNHSNSFKLPAKPKKAATATKAKKKAATATKAKKKTTTKAKKKTTTKAKKKTATKAKKKTTTKAKKKTTTKAKKKTATKSKKKTTTKAKKKTTKSRRRN